jgi:hypothetical protein
MERSNRRERKMAWLIEAVRANPIQFLSMLISAVALGVAASSLLASRQSMKTAKQSLETAQKALGATHLPNMGLDLRFEPHEGEDENLQFFFRNMGAVRAINLAGEITVSHEGRDVSFQIKNQEQVEPNKSWSGCFQHRFVKACLELAPKVFEAGRRGTDIKLRLAVLAPRIGISIKLNWESPAYGIGSVELEQCPGSWNLPPSWMIAIVAAGPVGA